MSNFKILNLSKFNTLKISIVHWFPISLLGIDARIQTITIIPKLELRS